MTSTFTWDDKPLVSDMQSNTQKQTEGFSWDQAPLVTAEEDSTAKSALRTLYQPVSGYAKKYTFPADIAAAYGYYDALAEIEDLSERNPNFDKEKAIESLNEAIQFFPTQENIEHGIESATGAPLTPKNRGQKLLKLASSAAAFKGGGAPEKTLAAGLAPTMSEIAKQSGVPEEYADLLGLAGSQFPFGKGTSRPVAATSESISKDLIGGEPPPSMFKTSDAALKELQANEARPKPFQQIKVSQEPKPESLAGRVKKENMSQLGVRVPAAKPNVGTQEQRALNTFRHEVYNSRQAGEAVTKQIKDLDEAAYKNVNDLYAQSREANAGLEDIRPDLVKDLQSRIQDIDRIPDPSTVQKKLRDSQIKLINRLAEFDAEGNITGYKPISNQDLIDQVQSWRQNIDYDFTHGDPINIYRPSINAVQDSVIKTAERTGNTKALNTFQNARTAYREWAENFDNDYVRPFRNNQRFDYTKNFNRLKDFDNFNIVKPLLEQTSEGKILLEGIQRDVADQYLSKFYDNPNAIHSKEFQRTLRELRAVLDEDQVKTIEQAFSVKEQKFNRRAKDQTPANAEKSTAKYLNKTPEDIQKMLNTRSGIQELRKDLEKTPNRFDVLSKQKVREILRNGQIEATPSGKQLYEVMNKSANRELLEELVGEEAFEEALNASKELGAKEASRENMKKYIKNGAIIKVLGLKGLLF